ncbi:Translation initiation factor eIF-2B subunit epsilon [Habropoda laboriosa]|uniref:Translation initiation factor eIF2B subunit epsilon n=1 Tax=Habropoda laboriosa TaxID=597456 RepID=A0A0L7REU0_9HYME|nr:Translation initiation factor eIF-2B subunit epsilon [Habropoda laboriosa]
MGKKEIIQAVVVADDFVTHLTPIKDVLPSILTPVINVSLLNYLVETLIKSGVQELFLYCSRHVHLIKSQVKNLENLKISISLIISDGCTSFGDALRDIYTKGSIRGNFILIRGDAFINANLASLISNHCAKLEKDKGAAMTMVLRNFGSMNDSLLKREACLIVSDKSSKKILHYSKLRNDKKKVKLELNWFLNHSEIEINTCFLDTHVYLCSPSVLPLFVDNFDFQTMEDFIRGVLMNEEILNSRIYWQQLNPEDYSLPIMSWKAYHTLNRDILNRHCFPLTPNAVPCLTGFICMPRYTYKHKTATLCKGSILEKDSIVCRNSILGNNTSVTRSVIGYNCLIGYNEFQYFKEYDTVECDNYSTDTTTSDEGSVCHSPVPDDTNMFLTEVIDSLLRGFQDKLNCENLILEINSSRYAYNITMSEVIYNVIKAILSLPFHYLSERKETVTNQNYEKNLLIMINYFQPIILNYVKTEDAQENCLHAIEEVASTTQELLPFLQRLLHLFYCKDVLSEDKILEWYESNDKDIDEFQKNKVRTAIKPFIKWLEEAEEDSSESGND